MSGDEPDGKDRVVAADWTITTMATRNDSGARREISSTVGQ
jgi:hypothetical protein